jgi:hypothetical protein
LSPRTDFGLPTATTGESAEHVHQAALAEAAKVKGWEERQRLRKAAGRPVGGRAGYFSFKEAGPFKTELHVALIS